MQGPISFPGPPPQWQTWDCWGCYLSRDLIDQHSSRSHPNKAVDVVFAKPPEKVFGPCSLNSCLLQSCFWPSPWKLLSRVLYASLLRARYAVVAVAPSGKDGPGPRNGSYTSPVTHSRCISTASFRATRDLGSFSRVFASPTQPSSTSVTCYQSRACSHLPCCESIRCVLRCAAIRASGSLRSLNKSI